MQYSPIELCIDALITVTDINAYEKYNLDINNKVKDITHFERKIYAQDIIDIFKGEDGFTILTLIEDGEKKEMRVLEGNEFIENILNKVSLLNDNKDVHRFLNKKIKEIS